MPSTTDTPAVPKRKKSSVLDMAVQGVEGTLSRPGELEPIAISSIERPGVRSKLQLDRSTGTLPVKYIRPDPDQPRKIDTTAQAFRELVASVKEHGIIQPITVRYVEKGDHFQIIAGERRYRAALAAGLEEMPAIVKDLDDTDKAVHQLEENIQRQDLNPIEEAAAIQRLMAAKGYSQRQVAEKIHKPESYVSEILAIDERLTRQEKASIVKLRTSEVPNKSLIYAALRAPDQETRQTLLFGQLAGKRVTVAGARAAIAEKKRPAGGRPKAFTEHISLDELGATVTIRFPKKVRVAPESVLEALDAARAMLKRKPPR